ncbi:MAG: 2-C-methyl-D-erythritol 2,4-cyclodiphosphate synthase [Alistipes sp.]|nr:2-C-methyl-D-erythritol 2,4-cyclodiphosphate synthase [Alistipes sp.]
MNIRIGHGYDVHRLAETNEKGEKLPLRLCGVTIPHSKGCVAHSDGDAAIHALCDALLGAAALGDIGLHFPDTAAEFRGIDSVELLRRTVKLLRAQGWTVGNVDCTVALQTPKIRPYIDDMRRELATALGIDVGAVSVKATTTERLGFVGREEGVEAHAAVLIHERLC